MWPVSRRSPTSSWPDRAVAAPVEAPVPGLPDPRAPSWTLGEDADHDCRTGRLTSSTIPRAMSRSLMFRFWSARVRIANAASASHRFWP